MAEKTFGAAFYMARAVDPTGPLLKIAEVLSVKSPALSRGTIDATTHDSEEGIMEFIGEGVADPGELTVQIHWVPTSDSDATMISGLLYNFPLRMKVVSNGRTALGAATRIQTVGYGIVTSYEPDDQPVQGKQTATLTVKASGGWLQGPFEE
jgi:hypothetical protein